MNPGTIVTITTPPLPGSRRSTSSGTLRGWGVTPPAELCEKITGARLAAIAWRMTSGETWLRSTSMPRRFISPTTATPNGDRPLCFASSVALSAHSVVWLWVSVM